MPDNRKNKEKKPSGRAHLKDFHKNEKGEYEYKGDSFVFKKGIKQYRKYIFMLWTLSLLNFAFLIICGCIPAGGMMNTYYVIIPYTAGIIFSVSFIYFLFGLSSKDGKLREYIYRKNTRIVTVCSLSCAVFCFISAVGNIVFCFASGAGVSVWDALFAVLICADVLFAILIRNLISGAEWERVSGDKGEGNS